MANLGISDEAMRKITDVIASFTFVIRAVIFGSRAKGNYKKYSDVDICLFGEIDAFQAERVRGSLNELNVIYEFDVVAYNNIKTTALREHIDRVGIEIFTRERD